MSFEGVLWHCNIFGGCDDRVKWETRKDCFVAELWRTMLKYNWTDDLTLWPFEYRWYVVLQCNTTITDQERFNFRDPIEKYLWAQINTSLFTQILETQFEAISAFIGWNLLGVMYHISRYVYLDICISPKIEELFPAFSALQ